MNSKLNIRFAEKDDLSALVEIYNQAIRSKTSTGDMTEFTVEERVDWFNKFDPNTYPIYVAELNNKVVGYGTISPYRPGRKALDKTAEISFYVDYADHKQGIGSTILNHAISDCERIGKEVLLAFLLDINTSSIGLLKKYGFEEWGRFPTVFELDEVKCGHLIYGVNLREDD